MMAQELMYDHQYVLTYSNSVTVCFYAERNVNFLPQRELIWFLFRTPLLRRLHRICWSTPREVTKRCA